MNSTKRRMMKINRNTIKFSKLSSNKGYTKNEVRANLIAKGFNPRYSGKDKGFYY